MITPADDGSRVVVRTRTESGSDTMHGLVPDHEVGEEGTSVLDYYDILGELGEGCFGMVSKVQHKIHGQQ